MGMVSSERILKLMDEDQIENLSLKPENPTITDGIVEFRNVWFAYKNEEWVLKDVSFKIKKGETVAMVGATGSGKTTIISLLNRFYDIQRGQILIDGTDIKMYSLSELRSAISMVLQDVFLFSDSIYNNITLGNPDISVNIIEQGAGIIGINKFIDKLPGRLDYRVGERGTLLSMGQRQLISFLRAYVHQPRILILDEATSSIDSESEVLINEATRIITKDRTSFVIAHRLATIRHADRIIVIDHGELVEQGSHDDLLLLNGFYFNLYQTQFKDQEATGSY
jgi:ATP-binding cassette subfamily B protein